jgi:23S rRNA (cytidine2498-2'-O)-methyltransferase
VHRARLEFRAPSRSTLKIEEVLGQFGNAPEAGQTVVDLGAAPGGWTHAFLRRGCRVIAVDRAALRISGLNDLTGRLTHLREDGLRYRPQAGAAPVDWLLSDMLVPPGVALGLLRKWIERGWARRFIANVKLPQRHAYRALAPLESYLFGLTQVRAHIRQLHHDRREVTAWGTVSDPAPRSGASS